MTLLNITKYERAYICAGDECILEDGIRNRSIREIHIHNVSICEVGTGQIHTRKVLTCYILI